MKEMITTTVLTAILFFTATATAAPQLTITSPADGTVTSETSINVYGTASSINGISFVTVNGNNAGQESWSKNVTLSIGTNAITVIAYENSTNDNYSTEKSIKVIREFTGSDTTPPVIDNISPTNGFLTRNSSVNMSIQAHDNVELSYIKINGNAATEGASSWSYTINLVDGQNQIEVIAGDLFDNQATQIVNYTRQTGPMIYIYSPADWTVTKNNSIDVSGYADPSYAIVKVNGTIAGDGTNWSKNVSLNIGTNQISIVAEDNFLHNSSEKIINIIRQEIDSIPPVIDSISPANEYSTDEASVEMTIQAHDNVNVSQVLVNNNQATFSTNGYKYTINLIVGQNQVNVIAKDDEGNQSTQNVNYIRHSSGETNGLLLFISSPTNWHQTATDSVDVSGSVVAVNGLKSIVANGFSATISDTTNWSKNILLASGTNKISVVATDYANNSIEKIIYVIRLNNSSDTEPPVITGIFPGNNYSTTASEIFINIQASDNVGIDYITINNKFASFGTSWYYNASLHFGKNELKIIAADAAGNQATQLINYIRQSSTSTNLPELNIISPANWSQTSEPDIDIYGTAYSPNGLMMITVNNILIPVESNWFKNVPLVVGTNQISVIAMDYFSNLTEKVTTVVRINDLIPPVIDSCFPGNFFSTEMANVSVLINAHDNIGVDYISINNFIATDVATGWIYNVSLSLGTNLLEIIAADAAGNQATQLIYYIRSETNQALVIITDVLPTALVGNSYKISLMASGGTPPFNWSIINGTLPKNLVLMPNGDICGIPEETGEFTTTIKVDDGSLSASTSVVLNVVSQPTNAIFLTHTVVDAIAGESYRTPLIIVDPYQENNWVFSAIDSLPEGLELTADGKLKGQPSVAGVYSFKVKALRQYNAQTTYFDNDEEITGNISVEIVDTKEDELISEKTVGAKTIINWKKRRNPKRETPKSKNFDKLIFKMIFDTEPDFSMKDKKFAVNFGNFTVPLTEVTYKNNGKTVALANARVSKYQLEVKGKVKIKKNGKLIFIIKVKDAALDEVFGIENKTENSSNINFPAEFIVGDSIGHSIFNMQLKNKQDKKAVLKKMK